MPSSTDVAVTMHGLLTSPGGPSPRRAVGLDIGSRAHGPITTGVEVTGVRFRYRSAWPVLLLLLAASVSHSIVALYVTRATDSMEAREKGI